MPNHISNKLTLISDDVAEREKFFAVLVGDDKDLPLIDFRQFFQYPKIFKDLDDIAEQYEKDHPEDRVWKNRPKDGYGSGGYQWCIANWGTKWNAYAQHRVDEFSIYFKTAWNTPKPIFEAIAKKFPDLNFMVEYADEDRGSNAGILTYFKGRNQEELLKGEQAVQLWFKLNPKEDPKEDPKEWGYDSVTFEQLDD